MFRDVVLYTRSRYFSVLIVRNIKKTKKTTVSSWKNILLYFAINPVNQSVVSVFSIFSVFLGILGISEISVFSEFSVLGIFVSFTALHPREKFWTARENRRKWCDLIRNFAFKCLIGGFFLIKWTILVLGFAIFRQFNRFLFDFL